MRDGWEIKKLGDLCEFQRGLTYTKTDEVEISDNIVLRATNIDLSTNLLNLSELKYISDRVAVPDSKKVSKNSMMICTASGSKSHLEKVAYIDDDYGYAFGGFMGMITPKSALLPRYLFHLMTSDAYKDFIGKVSDGANINNLKFDDLRGFLVPLPSISEQQRIVSILDQVFEGIATAKANAENNLKNARQLFESHLNSVFSQRGEGWVEKSLGEVCRITSVLVDPRKDELLDLTHVGAGNIVSQEGALVNLKTSREESLISGKFLFDDSMVLYSKIRPYLMKVVRPDFSGLCSADIYPLTPNLYEITRSYLFHLLLSKSFTDYAIQGSERAGMPKVNREHLFGFLVWLPTIQKQKELSEKLDQLHSETKHLESIYRKKIAALDALKKSILQKAFAGELS